MLKVREGSNSTPTCIYIREMSACLHKTLKLETTQCACIREWINKLQHTHKMGYHTARTADMHNILLCESSHIYKSTYCMILLNEIQVQAKLIYDDRLLMRRGMTGKWHDGTFQRDRNKSHLDDGYRVMHLYKKIKLYNQDSILVYVNCILKNE